MTRQCIPNSNSDQFQVRRTPLVPCNPLPRHPTHHPSRPPQYLLALFVMLLGVVGTTRLDAQTPSGWALRSSAAADLWFHSMALTGYDAFGAVPLYLPGYAVQVRAARERAGKGPTRLEREAGILGSAFAADRDFEVLHFVPMYFAAADVDQMIDALDAVAADGERAAARLPVVARFGAAAISSVLKTPLQRATLARFVAAVRAEWTSDYRMERIEQSAARNAAIQAASRTWAEQAAPAVGAALAEQSLDAGVILVSPPLGQEGRFFAGRPNDRTDNLVAVHLSFSTAAAGDAAWLAVREMSFTSARQALAAAGALPADPEAGEVATGRAAAHLGAALVAAHGGAASLDAYRSALVRVLGRPVPTGPLAIKEAFQAAYPLTAAAAALGRNEY